MFVFGTQFRNFEVLKVSVGPNLTEKSCFVASLAIWVSFLALSPIRRSAHFRIGDRSIVVFAGDMFSLAPWEGGREGGREGDRQTEETSSLRLLAPNLGHRTHESSSERLISGILSSAPLPLPPRDNREICLRGKFLSLFPDFGKMPHFLSLSLSLSLSVDLIPSRTCIQLTDDCCCPI